MTAYPAGQISLAHTALTSSWLTAALLSAAVLTSTSAHAESIGAFASCSANDDALRSIPEEYCAHTLSSNGSFVTTDAMARMNDGHLRIRSEHSGGAGSTSQVDATISDTISFTGGDPAGFRVGITMLMRTRFIGELAGASDPFSNGWLSMSLDSTDGSSVGGFASAAIALFEGKLELVHLAADYPPGFTILGGGISVLPSESDELLAEVGMDFIWESDFNPLHFNAGVSFQHFSGNGDVLFESYNSGMQLSIPEGVKIVSGSEHFLNVRQAAPIPAPAPALLLLAGLAGLLARERAAGNH